MAMVQLEVSVALLKMVLLSLLAEPGAMLRVDLGGGAPTQYVHVLQATEWGALALDVVLKKMTDPTAYASISICKPGFWKLMCVLG